MSFICQLKASSTVDHVVKATDLSESPSYLLPAHQQALIARAIFNTQDLKRLYFLT